MVQGTASSAGKTTLVTALCRIFLEKGFSVAPFKAQNMSNYAYKGKDFEISRAQAVQALASRIEISPDLNPILLKPLGDYRSSVFLRGKFYKKMHANDYYSKDCMWYEPVQFSKQSKDILREFPELSKDLAQVARNNDIYKEVCK